MNTDIITPPDFIKQLEDLCPKCSHKLMTVHGKIKCGECELRKAHKKAHDSRVEHYRVHGEAIEKYRAEQVEKKNRSRK